MGSGLVQFLSHTPRVQVDWEAVTALKLLEKGSSCAAASFLGQHSGQQAMDLIAFFLSLAV